MRSRSQHFWGIEYTYTWYRTTTHYSRAPSPFPRACRVTGCLITLKPKKERVEAWRPKALQSDQHIIAAAPALVQATAVARSGSLTPKFWKKGSIFFGEKKEEKAEHKCTHNIVTSACAVRNRSKNNSRNSQQTHYVNSYRHTRNNAKPTDRWTKSIISIPYLVSISDLGVTNEYTETGRC